MSRTRIPLITAIVAPLALGLPAGCPPTEPDGGAVGGDLQFAFPSAGDQLVVVTDRDGGRLTVFGSRSSQRVTGIEVLDSGAAYEAEFDGQGRTTYLSLDDVSINFFHNDDGTFDYTLRESRAIIGEGVSASPSDDLVQAMGGTAKSKSHAQAGGASEDAGLDALDLLLCAGGLLERTAARLCARSGYPGSPAGAPLAEALKRNKRLLHAATLLCATDAVGKRFGDAWDECVLFQRENQCEVLDGASKNAIPLMKLIGGVADAEIEQERLALVSTAGLAEACGASPPVDTEPGDDDSGGGNGDGDGDDDSVVVIVGRASGEICPDSFLVDVSPFPWDPALVEYVFHSYEESTPYFGQCNYVRGDGVESQLWVSIWYRPPSEGSPHGACGRAAEGEIVTAQSGCLQRDSTRRMISALYCLSVPIRNSMNEPAHFEVLDELIRNAVAAGVGAACE